MRARRSRIKLCRRGDEPHLESDAGVEVLSCSARFRNFFFVDGVMNDGCGSNYLSGNVLIRSFLDLAAGLYLPKMTAFKETVALPSLAFSCHRREATMTNDYSSNATFSCPFFGFHINPINSD